MGKIRALTIAGALAFAPQFAQAADMLPPPPMPEPPMLRGTVSPEFSGWYLRGDVGVSANQLHSTSSDFLVPPTPPGFRYDSSNLGGSAFMGIGAGYQFNNWFRADMTAEYRTAANYHAVASYNGAAFVPNPCGGLGRCPDVYTGSISSAVFLANGYVDLGTWSGITPYIGAGVGLANVRSGLFVDHSIGNTGGGYSLGASKTNFAWAGMAGLSYTVSPNLKLDMGYRYLSLGNGTSGPIICQPAGVVGCPQEVQKFKIASHDFKLGMRWMISDSPAPVYAPAPQYAPAPLMRKY